MSRRNAPPHEGVSITVPGAVGNMGSGFDCAGLSISLFNTFVFRRAPACRITSDIPDIPLGSGNLCLRAFHAGLSSLGVRPFPVELRISGRIPPGRGLGSSGTAVLAGTVAAFLLAGRPVRRHEVLCRALAVEPHVDDMAASLHGGFVAAGRQDGELRVLRLPAPPDLRVVLFIPAAPLSTQTARRVLPQRVPMADAVANVFAASCLAAAFALGRMDLLAAGSRDRLHQSYRSRLIPHLAPMLEAARAAGALGAVLSGAGPSVACFVRGKTGRAEAAFRDVAEKLGVEGDVRVCRVSGGLRWKGI